MTFRGVVSEVYEAGSIEEAVNMATVVAQKDDIVLFSPACKDATMDYAQRGDTFVSEVNKRNSENH